MLIRLALTTLITCFNLGLTVAQDSTETTFTILIENVSDIGKFDNTGVFTTPVSQSEPGPILPGQAYEFEFPAFMAERLGFITMVVESNDLFIATDPEGIMLYDENGAPPKGDITDQVYLWDAGTEVNEPFGEGSNQAPRQKTPNTGDDENGVVQLVSNLDDGLIYPEVGDLVRVTITPLEETESRDGAFRIRIENVSDQTALTPGIWVLHNLPSPFFKLGEQDYGEGLETLAEDGNYEPLATVFGGSDIAITPVIWIVHKGNQNPFFIESTRTDGLEAFAEDGNPEPLFAAINTMEYKATGIAGEIMNMGGIIGLAEPGKAYAFEVTASPGDKLSFATMFAETNDLFFATENGGITLFEDDQPISGNVTRYVALWDAGTEQNESPDEAPNPVTQINYPPVPAFIRVTITPIK